jgi:hypothetical protein
MDWFILAYSIVFIVLLIVGNVYWLAHYAHPKDTAFGQSILIRALVVRLILSCF